MALRATKSNEDADRLADLVPVVGTDVGLVENAP
jgi:hypothetical protein